jgi:hypothetical protein
MAQNANTNCLYTSVRNISGSERVFGFLGARGMRLAANEVVTVPGDLVDALGRGGHWSQRRFKSLERALDTLSVLEIIATPAVHLYDAVCGRTKILALENGVLGMLDPCWDSDGTSEFTTSDPCPAESSSSSSASASSSSSA